MENKVDTMPMRSSRLPSRSITDAVRAGASMEEGTAVIPSYEC